MCYTREVHKVGQCLKSYGGLAASAYLQNGIQNCEKDGIAVGTTSVMAASPRDLDVDEVQMSPPTA